MTVDRRRLLQWTGLGLLASAAAARSATKVRKPTAMSEWTAEQFRHWADTMKANAKGDSRRTSAEVLALLERSAQIDDGSGVTQKEHCLQTATRALRDGADEELVVAALLHDVGKVYDGMNHGAIAAEILRAHVSRETYEVVRNHMTFEARFYGARFPSIEAREKSCVAPVYLCTDGEAYRNMEQEPWYALAMRFTGEWDQRSFDPEYDTLPVAYFEPMVRRVFDRRTFAAAGSEKKPATLPAGR